VRRATAAIPEAEGQEWLMGLGRLHHPRLAALPEHSYFIAISGWSWTWRCSPGIKPRRSSRSRSCSLLDGLDQTSRPTLMRGDCQWGTERAMEGAEQRSLPYVFKLKQSAKVKKLIEKLLGRSEWGGGGTTVAGSGDRTTAQRVEQGPACGGATAGAAPGGGS
jgi:hypothetical protein